MIVEHILLEQRENLTKLMLGFFFLKYHSHIHIN